jgi:hypothetical protein
MIVWSVLGWVIPAGSVALLLAALAGMRLRSYRSARDREWAGESSETAEFSLARYEPMARLLSEEDFVFLAAQPGYRPEIGARLRRERRRIFRLYLRDLSADFHRLHAQARRMVANSGAEHSELVGILMRQQLIFWRGLLAIEVRLALSGVGLGQVDVRGLVEAIETMRLDLARFSSPAQASA